MSPFFLGLLLMTQLNFLQDSFGARLTEIQDPIRRSRSTFKGILPGSTQRVEAERVLGQPLRRVSDTLSEYKANKEREMIFVQYRRQSDVVERIEVIYLDAMERSAAIKTLALPKQAAVSQINPKGVLEEYFRFESVVLTYVGADQNSRVSRVGYYSEELFESAVDKLARKSSATNKQQETPAGEEPPQSSLGPDRDGWGFNPQTATVLTYFGSTSAPACRSECEKNPKCMAFSWIRPGGILAGDPPMCYLMSAWIKMVQHPCCISGVRNSQ